jgi:glycosyltransferase involved in cell wall biosynthesis
VLSLCMIVKNEQAVLDRCLASARGAVDEIIVVDTGSTDDTIETARDHGAKVLHHDFTDFDFAAARNRSLNAATGDFALVLDADETLHPAGKVLIRRLAAESAGHSGPVNHGVGYVINRHNRREGTPATVDHAVRLFALRPGFRYRGRVHETVDTAILEAGGRLRRSHVIVEHHLPAAQREAEKGRLYLRLLERDLADDPDDVDRLTFLAAEHHKLGDFRSATEVAERIAGLLPDDFGAHLTLALYHFAYGGDRARARRSVRTALHLRPDDPEAQGLLSALENRAALDEGPGDRPIFVDGDDDLDAVA